MRFKEFINEDQKFDLAKFQDDCAYYIEQMKSSGAGLYMFRGDKNSPRTYNIREFEPRERPRDTRPRMHEQVNEFFEEKFGLPFRNGLFVTGHSGSATGYGPLTVIFPIGKFEWLCNLDEKLYDMTGAIEDERSDIRSDYPDYDMRQIAAENNIFHFMQESDKWKHNKDLVKCVKSKNEIMLWPHRYYVFNFNSDAFYGNVAPFLDQLS